jgi:hypothetical protein
MSAYVSTNIKKIDGILYGGVFLLKHGRNRNETLNTCTISSSDKIFLFAFRIQSWHTVENEHPLFKPRRI